MPSYLGREMRVKEGGKKWTIPLCLTGRVPHIPSTTSPAHASAQNCHLTQAMFHPTDASPGETAPHHPAQQERTLCPRSWYAELGRVEGHVPILYNKKTEPDGLEDPNTA